MLYIFICEWPHESKPGCEFSRRDKDNAMMINPLRQPGTTKFSEAPMYWNYKGSCHI